MISLIKTFVATAFFLGALAAAAPKGPPPPGDHCPGDVGSEDIPGLQSGINIYWHDYGAVGQNPTACNVALGPAFTYQDVAALDQKYKTSETCGRLVKISYNGIEIQAQVIDSSDFDDNISEGGCNGVVVNKSTFEKFGVSTDVGIIKGASWQVV